MADKCDFLRNFLSSYFDTLQLKLVMFYEK